jgi:hypothetical protein
MGLCQSEKIKVRTLAHSINLRGKQKKQKQTVKGEKEMKNKN